MLVDWLTFIKPAGSLLIGAKSIYDRVRGNAPTADFAPGQYGVVLHIRNDRSETVIIERVDATPALLMFSVGDRVDDVADAMTRAQGIPIEDALVVLRSKEETELQVIRAGAFKTTPANQRIKIAIQWRTSSRTLFSRNKVSKTITVLDVMDLEISSEKRRTRPAWIGL